MNCADVIASLGFRCKSLENGAIRVWSPFTYGHDGELVALYVEPSPSGFIVTDNAQSLMHAASMGANITKSRLAAIQRCARADVIVSEGGEIRAQATVSTLSQAIVNVLNAALAVSHSEVGWLPRPASSAFTDAVGEALQSVVGDRLKRNITVVGASGHQIEIPFVVESEARKLSERTYIQPVAYGADERLDWDNVYRGLGKMLDLKNAGAEEHSRSVILEDATPDEEIAKAATLLTVCASVVYFSKIHQWASRRFLSRV
jgi:hypothetical protein